MSDRRLSLADLPHRVREYLDELPARYRGWRQRLREDRTLIWRTPVVRIAIWIILGVATYFAVAAFIRFLTPTPGRGDTFEAATKTAVLRVACTNPGCLHAATIERPMTFKDWPLRCETCGRDAVYRARMCQTCRRWFAVPGNAAPLCPHCAASKSVTPGQATPSSAPAHPDDAEDGWG